MMYLQLSSKSSDQEQKTDGGDDSAESGMSFEDATDALREAEEKERQASRGAMFEEVCSACNNMIHHDTTLINTFICM